MRVGFDGLSDELCQELNLQVLDGRLSLLEREKAEGDHEVQPTPPGLKRGVWLSTYEMTGRD